MRPRVMVLNRVLGSASGFFFTSVDNMFFDPRVDMSMGVALPGSARNSRRVSKVNELNNMSVWILRSERLGVEDPPAQG